MRTGLPASHGLVFKSLVIWEEEIESWEEASGNLGRGRAGNFNTRLLGSVALRRRGSGHVKQGAKGVLG